MKCETLKAEIERLIGEEIFLYALVLIMTQKEGRLYITLKQVIMALC